MLLHKHIKVHNWGAEFSFLLCVYLRSIGMMILGIDVMMTLITIRKNTPKDDCSVKRHAGGLRSR